MSMTMYRNNSHCLNANTKQIPFKWPLVAKSRGFATLSNPCHQFTLHARYKNCQLTNYRTLAFSRRLPNILKMASQNFVLKLSVLALATCVAQGFFLGSEKEGTFIPFEKLKDLGLSRDHKVYSHLVIPPWSRPFKLGYCESWEWHTDPKYRAQRLAICKELSEGTHECDSPTGFCDDKCPYTNASYPFWRLRNSAEVQIVWTVSSIQMFSSSSSNKNLIENPTKAYASSYFGPGYYPSNAFDNNPETIWVSNGQAPPGMQWLAFEFDHPVSIGSIRIASEIDKPERAPTEIYVEGSCEKYFRTFETMWVIRNPMQKSDIRAHGELKRRDAGKPRFRRFR